MRGEKPTTEVTGNPEKDGYFESFFESLSVISVCSVVQDSPQI